MIILEIPIYSMKKKEFNERWENHIKEMVSQTNIENRKEFEKNYRNYYIVERQWKYNQIIGFLVIYYENGTVWFDEYCTMDKNIRFKSNKKHFIQNLNLGGYHFWISNEMTNKSIQEEIIHWITSFEEEVMDKKYFLDKDKYLKIIKHLDIKKMINK